MRVSFDTNAWETIFGLGDAKCAPIHAALVDRRLEGFICESGFRIEAIRKRDRVSYFARPYMDCQLHGIVTRNDRQYMHWSIGPADDRHPGLPVEQADKLQRALRAGVRLMRGSSWMGLPAPKEIRDPSLFAPETAEAARKREQLQLDVSTLIDRRGVGKAAFDAAGGWSERVEDHPAAERLRKACAEWADGELASAHIAYRNDVLCTNDFARAAGKSIFDGKNRSWLTAEFGVVFRTVDELVAEIAK